MPPTVALHTIGCKVNQYDSWQLLRRLYEAGYELVDFNSPLAAPVDLYIVYTCTVTQAADHKSKQAIHRAIRYARENHGKVISAGCYSQVNRAALQEVDLAVGVDEIDKILQWLQQCSYPSEVAAGAYQRQAGEEYPLYRWQQRRTRALLKIQDGCEHFCSYCIVPYARGKERSKPLEEIIKEAKELYNQGYQEIVLCGVRLGAYYYEVAEKVQQFGCQSLVCDKFRLKPNVRNNKINLAQLIGLILEQVPIPFLRLSSIEPLDISDELICVLAKYKDRICPHFHIPLQSASDNILKLMRRGYTASQFFEIVRRLRSQVAPEAAITTDIMVGFPGESAADFQATIEFCQTIKFAKAHIFRYSPRPMTAAAKYNNQLPEKIKQQRSQRLISLTRALSDEYKKSFVGRDIFLLIEQSKAGWLSGTTPNYLKVSAPATTESSAAELIGSYQRVKIKEVNSQGIAVAELCRP